MKDTPPNYTPVEIRILPATEAGYPVELTVNQDQQFAGGYLPADMGQRLSGVSDTAQGQQLFATLFSHPETLTAWAEIRGQSPHRQVRLRIDAQAPELHALPWELLSDNHTLLAADSRTPFSRYLALPHRPLPAINEPPLKMLAVIANPNGLNEQYQLTPLDVDREKANLQTALAEVADIQLTFLDELPLEDDLTTLSALGRRLSEGYHLLHVVTHGAYNNKKKTAALLLSDEYNDVALVTADKITKMLQRQGDLLPHLICLASCETATQDTEEAFSSLAARLVQAGVPAVVAMQGHLNMTTAQTFSQTFYRRLLGHGRLDLAVNEARADLLTAELTGAGLPVLFSRLADNRLFVPADKKPATSRRGLTGDLVRDIKTVLLDCDELHSARQLRDVFTVATLRPWRNRLPMADSPAAQADALIAYLADAYNVDNDNALVLFLREMQQRYDPAVQLHHDLGLLANQLAAAKRE